MVTLDACPRCSGAVLDYTPPESDSALCINCGWRPQEVPSHIQDQVEAHLGKPYMEDRYSHDRIGTGKPPLSGWERIKRRRARERSTSVEDGGTLGLADRGLRSSASLTDDPSVVA